MNQNTPNPYLARGTITITSPPADIDIKYCEHPSRNSQLIPDLDGIKLSLPQTDELKKKLLIEENKIWSIRTRYARLAIQDQILEEEEG